MQLLAPRHKASLQTWESRPIHPQVHQGPKFFSFLDDTCGLLANESPGPPLNDGPFARVEAAILNYQIFGPSIGQGLLRRQPVEVGDTVGLRYTRLGFVHLFFACRVTEVFRQRPTREGLESGFTYQTLSGHPEVGEETFRVYKTPQGQVFGQLRAWSHPNWYTWPGLLLARYLQREAAHAAIRHLQSLSGGS